ncbi:MAG: bifunctional demethylmenaquinone methyltransferase/2-methoxy-6-polyprenyl-1,4-benzoquinol methylase UbiE [Rickettsiales bacterium]
MENTQKTTHFGYRDVPEEEKSGLVKEVFSSVASRYDVMNDLMSGGLHHVWKDRLIDTLRPSPSMHLLDVAGGTGDIAFRFLKRGGGQVTISDINTEMLEEGKRRAIDLQRTNITWQLADAEKLPFSDNQFDAYTISFGIRNVTHIDKVLSEAYRVLKPGGHFLCLEFSHPENAGIKKLYDAYSFKVIPGIGKAVTGNRDAYQYLVESIRKFPTAPDFETMIGTAGFARTTYTPMTFGVVALHSGWKI